MAKSKAEVLAERKAKQMAGAGAAGAEAARCIVEADRNGELDVPRTSSIQPKFQKALSAINAALVDREEEAELVLTALIANQHCLFVGPPGTAKSMVGEAVKDLIVGGKGCTIHCCKDTSRDAAFGPVKVSLLVKDIYERVLDGGAAGAHVLILEEVFKAGPAVLDMFLMLMNERVYKEGVFETKCPLRHILGVSNEWTPEGYEAGLGAFFDRFLFRKTVAYVNEDARRTLFSRAVSGTSFKPHFAEKVTVAELDEAHKQARSLPWTNEAKMAMWEITKELGKEGIQAGDRRMVLSFMAARAFAYLHGAGQVETEHLDVLRHVLWDDPQGQPAKADKVIGKLANPLRAQLHGIMHQARDVVAKVDDLGTRIDKLGDLEGKLKVMKDCPAKVRAVSYVTSELKKALMEKARIRS